MRKYLQTDGFKFNQYDPCLADKIIEGEPLAIVLHVYDVRASHKDTNVVYNF